MHRLSCTHAHAVAHPPPRTHARARTHTHTDKETEPWPFHGSCVMASPKLATSLGSRRKRRCSFAQETGEHLVCMLLPSRVKKFQGWLPWWLDRPLSSDSPRSGGLACRFVRICLTNMACATDWELTECNSLQVPLYSTLPPLLM